MTDTELETKSNERESYLSRLFNEPVRHMAASFLVGLYALGYMVTTVSNAQYGFYEPSLFHPRIVSAGCAFVLAVGIPVYLARTGYMMFTRPPIRQPEELGLPTYFKVTLTAIQINASLAFLSLFSSGLFVRSGQQPLAILSLVSWTGGLFLLASLAYSLYSSKVMSLTTNSAKLLAQGIWLVFGCVDALLLWKALFGRWASIQFRWIACMTIIATFDELDFPSVFTKRNHPWLATAVMLVLTLVGFSRYIYPELKPFWGGSPEAVTLTMKSGVRFQAGQQLKAGLIDQSSDGYYLLLKPGEHATFIPRANVEEITY